MNIVYKTDVKPYAAAVIDLYNAAQLPRPTQDAVRIADMFANSNLVVTAWHEEKLVGVARSITDWVWSTYLADLAVHPGYQKEGIGKKLVELTREKIGPQSMLLLLSVPTAMEYYPRIGFTKQESSFIINRES